MLGSLSEEVYLFLLKGVYVFVLRNIKEQMLLNFHFFFFFFLQLDVIQVFESSQMCYIVMEYAVNGDLTEFINYLGALCEPDARRLFKQLLEIVSYIHENNICHRHITCDNILLDENFNVKLAGMFSYIHENIK